MYLYVILINQMWDQVKYLNPSQIPSKYTVPISYTFSKYLDWALYSSEIKLILNVIKFFKAIRIYWLVYVTFLKY